MVIRTHKRGRDSPINFSARRFGPASRATRYRTIVITGRRRRRVVDPVATAGPRRHATRLPSTAAVKRPRQRPPPTRAGVSISGRRRDLCPYTRTVRHNYQPKTLVREAKLRLARYTDNDEIQNGERVYESYSENDSDSE